MLIVKDFHSEIAQVIKLHRRKARLTQKALADYAGVGKTVIYDIEHAKPSIQLNTLMKVLHVLNIKLVIDAPLTKRD